MPLMCYLSREVILTAVPSLALVFGPAADAAEADETDRALMSVGVAHRQLARRVVAEVPVRSVAMYTQDGRHRLRWPWDTNRPRPLAGAAGAATARNHSKMSRPISLSEEEAIGTMLTHERRGRDFQNNNNDKMYAT